MGKLTKLISVLKKLHSFGKLSRSSSSISDDNNDIVMTSSSVFSTNLHPVYVGKSRRQYLIAADVIHHPLFQELVGRKCTEISDDMIIVANCEVVLFDHLLWMLQNDDPHTTANASSFDDDLAHFYAC